MRHINTAEIMAAKVVFECVAHSYGVKVLNYRADNGRFKDNKFKTDCKRKNKV